ncbi:hypothetical protein F4777DRAFT_83587 [Nemania sp. FL0916]|nr:hypothetical protein F4777DRAFT_83587 [Nemania sp. FL0916]
MFLRICRRLLTNPHHLASLFLNIAVGSLFVAIGPPLPFLYLVRAEYGGYDGDATTSIIWFSYQGYCSVDVNNNVLSDNCGLTCHFSELVGYDVESSFARDGTSIISFPDTSTMSYVLTMGPYFLNILAIVLCFAGIFAHQVIIRRPQVKAYVIMMGSSLLALLTSGIAFVFEYSLLALITSGQPAEGITYTTTSGILIKAAVLAVICQVVACVLGFYTCIGGKYECEGGIRLESSEKLKEVGMISTFMEIFAVEGLPK